MGWGGVGRLRRGVVKCVRARDAVGDLVGEVGMGYVWAFTNFVNADYAR